MTTALVNTRTRKQWAKDINLAWFKSVDDVCDLAERSAQAHLQLGFKEFNKMCAEDLAFSEALANQFKRLGERPDIIGYARRRRLPKGYSSLFEFVKLDADSLKHAIENNLLTAKTTVRKSRAVVTALLTDSERPVGEGLAQPMLPSPTDANEIAKATGKMVIASDGITYTGTDQADQDQYNERLQQFYQALDAITSLADMNSVEPAFFLDNSEEWWSEKLSPSIIGDAVEWLQRLKKTLEARQ